MAHQHSGENPSPPRHISLLRASVVKYHLAVLLSLAAAVAAQTATKPANKALPWKSYCQPEPGFCFKYPAGWSLLGEVLDGNGVVVAPPQKEDRALWDAITIAMVVPSPQGDEEP